MPDDTLVDVDAIQIEMSGAATEPRGYIDDGDVNYSVIGIHSTALLWKLG